MDGGQQPPAQGTERVEVGQHMPSQGMDDEMERVEGGQPLPAQGMDAGMERTEGGQQPPAQGTDQGREVRGLAEGEGEDITDRIRPIIPAPNPEAGRGLDIDGWTAIGRVGAWDAMLLEGQLLDSVPEQHKSVWVWAAAEVLRRLHLAESEEEATLAL